MSLSGGIFVIALIAVKFAGGDFALAEGTPRADIRPFIWDFGYLPQKSEVSHQYYLYNTGTAPLAVTKIKPGCSCTSVSEIDRPIAPGDSVAIMVTFKSGRYHKTTKMTSKIHTNDPDTAVHRLRIFANVVKLGEETGAVSVIPQKLRWQVKKEKTVTGADTLRITNKGTDSLMITIRHAPEGITEQITFPQGTMLGPRAELFLYLARVPLPAGVGSPSLTLAFTGRDTTLVTVPIKIED